MTERTRFFYYVVGGGGSVAAFVAASMALTTAQSGNRVRPVGIRSNIDLRSESMVLYITVENNSDRAASICSDATLNAQDY